MLMMKSRLQLVSIVCLLMIAFVAAGCGGGGGVQRIAGLTADGVVKTFFDSAKNGRLNEAALYVSPTSAQDPRTVLKYLTGQSGLDELKNSNLLSLKKVAEQGDFSVVVATLQPEQGNMRITVKPVGLERINGEWYIVDFDKIYLDAKYKILQQLLGNI